MDSLLDRLRKALAPDYLLERELASGGMGTVFLARDPRLDRLVAIKILRPEITTATAIERFVSEARILASLSHPNIVPVHDVREKDEFHYYVMDYITGPTLAERLQGDRLTPGEVVRLGSDLLQGIGAAHEKGVIHRDIKPANIFLLDDRALLGDFGIARPSGPRDSPLTGPGGAIGTPGYMPPEQAAGGLVTDQTDLYAVGVVLYEACSGRRLHAPKSVEGTDWSGIPRWLRPLLRRALEDRPEDRWRDASEFRAALLGRSSETGRRRGLTALTAVALAVLVWILWPRDGTVSIHPTGADLAILPFATGSATTEVDGAEFAKLVQGNLEWFGRFKLTPAEYVSQWFQTRGASGANAATALRATFVVEGVLIHRSSDLVLRVTVRDNTAQTRDGFDIVSGSADLLSWSRAVADSVVRRIFPHHLENYRTLSAAVNPGNSLPAYRHYFAGEQAFQRDAYRTALAEYDSALALDSRFLWAAWRIAIVRRFLRQPFENDLRELYAGRGRELPGQYRGLIEALLEPDLTRRFARYRQVAKAYPRDGYVRFVYADELFHRGPLAGFPIDSALAQFREAVRIEPYLEQMPSWDHLLYGYIRLGRRAEADSALIRRNRIPPSGEDEDRRRRRFFKLAYDYRFQPWLAWLKGIGIRIGPDSTLLEGIQRYVRLGLSFDIPDAQMALGHILVNSGTLPYAKANGHQAQGMALLFLGRPRAALPQLDSAAALFGQPDSLLERAEWRVLPGALGLPGIDSTEVAWGIGVLRGLSGDSVLGPRAGWALAIAAQARGDTTEARRWSDPPRRRSATDTGAARLAVLLDAMLEADHGAVDSALRRTAPLLVYGPKTGGQDPFARSVLYLYRTRWFLLQGDSTRADQTRLWYQNSDNGIEGWPQRELEAGEVDEMLAVYARLLQAEADLSRGRKATACPLISRVLQLWAGAEPGLDPLTRRAAQVAAECAR